MGEVESVEYEGAVSFSLWVIGPAGCGTSIMLRSLGNGASVELGKGARSFSNGGVVVSMLGEGAVPTMIVVDTGTGIAYGQGGGYW